MNVLLWVHILKYIKLNLKLKNWIYTIFALGLEGYTAPLLDKLDTLKQVINHGNRLTMQKKFFRNETTQKIMASEDPDCRTQKMTLGL